MSRTVVDDPVLGDDKSAEAREIRCSLTVSRGSGLVLGFDLETKRLGEVVWKSGIRSRLIRTDATISLATGAEAKILVSLSV